ncbi:TetR/AcrR family transcriptional regulator [Streptomyces sparsogenes]|uniref:TetR/AcrR family transcriptional regulator n=1 Tax=Streptomyces sparsogenes TaxID=67365 RepID=UPI003324C98E
MTSKRNTAQDDDALLDAARDCVLAVGVRRTTLTDVARRAGVSRMTLYRRWPDVRGLVGDLMTREWLAVTVGAMPHPGPSGTTNPPLVEALMSGLQALRAHPLLRKILDVDPELMLPYLFDRRGASQDRVLEFIEDALRQGHADGSVRKDHPVRQARALLLILQSFALSMQIMTDDTDPELNEAAFYAEVRHILERILVP